MRIVILGQDERRLGEEKLAFRGSHFNSRIKKQGDSLNED
jgi:hypothetical protein